VKLDFIRPGKPVENGYIGSFKKRELQDLEGRLIEVNRTLHHCAVPYTCHVPPVGFCGGYIESVSYSESTGEDVPSPVVPSTGQLAAVPMLLTVLRASLVQAADFRPLESQPAVATFCYQGFR